MRTLGDNIRERRKALGMTQMELAMKAFLKMVEQRGVEYL